MQVILQVILKVIMQMIMKKGVDLFKLQKKTCLSRKIRKNLEPYGGFI